MQTSTALVFTDMLSLLAGGDTVVYEAVILCYSAILFKR